MPGNDPLPYELVPVDRDPFEGVADYLAQPPIGSPGAAPLDDFAPARMGAAQRSPVLPGLASVASDPSRSMGVRVPAAIGSTVADEATHFLRSAWGAATLPGDVATGKVDPGSQEAIQRSTDLAGLLTLPSVGAEADPNTLNAFTAYHGSPHSFDQFDMSKIGTGEGNKAYGHGLYFADNEEVAKGYRDTLSPGDLTNPNDVASLYLKGFNDKSAAIESMRQNAASHSPGDAIGPDVLNQAADLLASGHQPKNPGAMYQVGINANPDHFLDWDAPLSEQHPVVQGAFYGGKPIPENAQSLSGMNVIMKLAKSLGNPRSGAPEVSEFLKDKGVPGIKYLDQGSRGAGDGSHNYVVFDDNTINILKKYGLAGLGIGAGGAAMLGQDQPAQASGFSLTPVEGNPFVSAP